MVKDLSRFRAGIESALLYGGQTHRFEDIQAAVESGQMVAWPGERSVVITEIVLNPNGRKDLHLFLAAGNEKELKDLHALILDWGRTEGCERATIIGRHGWSRSWLTKDLGWMPTLTVFEKPIEAQKAMRANRSANESGV